MIGLDVYKKLLQYGSAFLLHLGRLLTLSQVTWLEVPQPEQLITAQILLNNNVLSGLPPAVFKVNSLNVFMSVSY